MPEVYLKQLGFTYSVCGLFIKKKEKMQKFKERGASRNRRNKPCFQHGIAYGDFKGLPRRTASDKVIRDKGLNIAKNPKK